MARPTENSLGGENSEVTLKERRSSVGVAAFDSRVGQGEAIQWVSMNTALHPLLTEGEIEDFGQGLDRFVVDRLMATR
jgi:hypothetical protein